MSLPDAYTNLASTLTGDADLTAWAAAVGGPLTVLRGNREVGRIPAAQLPALVLEPGDFDAELLVAGKQHDLTVEMKVSFVWTEKTEEDAFGRKQALPELVTRALMNDGTLGDAVAGAWVSAGRADFGYDHPRHAMGFTVTADLRVSR